MKIQFSNTDKMVDFENELSRADLLHNHTSNYRECIFDKDHYTLDENKEETNNRIYSIATKYGGKLI
jgi:hypothetical protein